MGVLERIRRPRGMARVAAVQPLAVLQSRSYRRFRQSRQERAAFFARRSGLIRFANGLLADSAARVILQAERQGKPGDDRSWEPVDSSLHAEIISRFRNDTEENRDLVRLLVWHDRTIGEALQVTDRDDRGRPQFKVRSSLFAEYTGRGVLIRELAGGMPGDGTAKWYRPEAVRRLWTPDQDEPLLATSPTMGVLDDLERYWALHRATKRRAESALAMNGILWTPSEAHAQLPFEQQLPGGTAQPGSKLQRDYYEIAKRALEDDDDVAAFVPFEMHWPHQFGPPEIREMKNALDPNGIAYRKEAVEDIARGLDYPQRLLVSGEGAGNHWSDWLLQEQYAKNAFAPVLERVLWRNLTNSYYRPALRGLAARGLFDDDPERYRFGFDMSPVIVHPDASTRSIELYKIAALGLDTMLEANGFDIADAPDADELKRWIQVQELLTSRTTVRVDSGGSAPATQSETTANDPTSAPGGPPQSPAPLALPAATLAALPAAPHPAELVGWLDS